MKHEIAIQGFEGSFHELAARNYWGEDVAMQYCATFREVVRRAVGTPGITGALMAIENSIAGSILPNYNLLRESKLQIIGEVYLEIRQNLLVNPGVILEDIQEVHSHPMAILQCLDFLEPYNWKLVETEDTALSAKHIQQQKSKHIAAIGATLAATLFGLNIIAPDIHAQKNNYTRFLVLSREAVLVPDADKASLYFQADDVQGRLALILQTIAGHGINLSKLQSMPIAGSNWLYGFYVDMEFKERSNFEQVLEVLRSYTQTVVVYGIYKKGKSVSS